MIQSVHFGKSTALAVTALLAFLCACSAWAAKPVVTLEFAAVDGNGDMTPASPVQGIIYLTEAYPALISAAYFAEGVDKPCELSGAWKAMPQESKTIGRQTEQGLAYFESPKAPAKVSFAITCFNSEGTASASETWEYLAAPEPPSANAAFALTEFVPVFKGPRSETGVSITYAIPGIGSSCIVWREYFADAQWQPIDSDGGYALYSLTAREGISGSITYSPPEKVTYPYRERFVYSCLNPITGFYADNEVIGVATYSQPAQSREAVVSIEQ